MAKIEVGKEQTLKVLRKADFGIYLGYEEEKDQDSSEDIKTDE